jgi:hypothetical protein
VRAGIEVIDQVPLPSYTIVLSLLKQYILQKKNYILVFQREIHNILMKLSLLTRMRQGKEEREKLQENIVLGYSGVTECLI